MTWPEVVAMSVGLVCVTVLWVAAFLNFKDGPR